MTHAPTRGRAARRITVRGIAVRVIAIVVLLGVWAGSTRTALAQSPIVNVDVSLAPSTVTIGDRVVLTVAIRHPRDVVVTATPTAPADVDLAAPQVTESTAGDGLVTTVTQVTLQPFRPGTTRIPPITVSWVTDGGTTGRFAVQSPDLVVTPVRAETDSAIRLPKEPATVPGAPAAWLRPVAILGGGVAAAIMLAWLGTRIRRFLALRRTTRTPAPVVSHEPEIAARQVLDGLGAGTALTTPDAYSDYYGTIASTVRRYLEQRFGFNASALTTRELEERMTAHGVDRWQARLVGGLLERCDAAVFAHRIPDAASADHDLTLAYEIVELARGADAPVAVTAGAPA